MTEKDDRHNGHEANLRDALDQAMATLCESVIAASRDGDYVPDTAVIALETTRMVALERRPYGEASRTARRSYPPRVARVTDGLKQGSLA